MQYILYRTRLRAGLLLIILVGTLAACARQQPSAPEAAALTPRAITNTALPISPTATAAPVPTTVAASPTTTASTSAQPEGDAKAAILAAAHAMTQAGPYHATGTIVTQKATNQLAIDVVPPDRFRYTISTPDGPFDYIGIGGTSYMKAKGVWHPAPLGGGDVLQTAEPLREDLVRHITNAKWVGTEKVDGIAARVYTYTMHTDGFDSDATLWVDAARGLPIKIESASQIANETLHATETITYDSAITINAPIQ